MGLIQQGQDNMQIGRVQCHSPVGTPPVFSTHSKAVTRLGQTVCRSRYVVCRASRIAASAQSPSGEQCEPAELSLVVRVTYNPAVCV